MSQAPESFDGSTHPFQDPELDPEARIDDLIGLMTLDEKIECLSTNPSVPRLGLQGSGHVEGLHGLALGGPGKWGRGAPLPTTTFPQAIGLAQTWEPELVRRVAEVEAREARHVFHVHRRGGLVIRAPNADLGRDPRWGRTEECYGEDPFFNGVMTVAFVRGLQGDDPRYWRAAALLKHFLANSNEDGRESSSSDFDERAFHEYYSVPFRMGIVEGGARAYMAAYNAHNGVPCAVHPVLKRVTVEAWGQDGIICTDGGAFKLLVSAHQAFPTLEAAAAATLRAGITQYLDDYRGAIRKALEEGLIQEAEIDQALRGNFRVMLRLGLLDPPSRVPYARVDSQSEPWKRAEHRAFCREVTAKSVVLLKNAGGLLPLDPENLGSVALIGPLADRVYLDWYSGTPPYSVSPLSGLRAALKGRASVEHVSGDDASQAVAAAGRADVCIVCVGNHPTGDAPWAEVTLPSYGKEAVDRKSLDLESEALVRAVFAANPRTIVALISSFPYAITWTQDNVPAILYLCHNSQELGNGLADVLLGRQDPGGRLVETWPRSLSDLLPMMDYDVTRGRTYRYFAGEPLYPFGFGLSYTTFRHHGLGLSSERLPADGAIQVSVDLENTGTRDGDEVLELYARYLSSAVPRPKLQLVAFQRVTLGPGERRTVDLVLQARRLAYFDAGASALRVEPGPLRVLLGRSATDIVLEKDVTIQA